VCFETTPLRSACAPVAVLINPNVVAKIRPFAIGYQHCFEDERLSVGIFLFGPGSEMPIHDHPDMVVVSQLCVCV
jgi:quercetin dioxygenase-like cupin family protein